MICVCTLFLREKLEGVQCTPTHLAIEEDEINVPMALSVFRDGTLD